MSDPFLLELIKQFLKEKLKAAGDDDLALMLEEVGMDRETFEMLMGNLDASEEELKEALAEITGKMQADAKVLED
jgi:hypothetical protein